MNSYQEVDIVAKLRKAPTLLQDFSGNERCCIFRTPISLLINNKDYYRPQILSIGPYHHGHESLEMMEQHKGLYVDRFLTRAGKSFRYFYDMISPMEEQIRRCYSEFLGNSCITQLMVIDAAFLIELFRNSEAVMTRDQDDPIFKMPWISPYLMRDLLMIENQIPYFVLQKMFDESRTPADPPSSLASLALSFFNNLVGRPTQVLERHTSLEGAHLLDLFRKSFIIQHPDGLTIRPSPGNGPLTLIQPATKLVMDGVKLKANHGADSFLDIRFSKGVISFPKINIDGFHRSFILNSVAFEQCHSNSSKDITSYVMFLRSLINTTADAALLSEAKIIERHFGAHKEIVEFFDKAGENVVFNVDHCYLKELSIDVDAYGNNRFHVGLAEFKRTYMPTIWAFLSTVAAIYLLTLASVQTFYTVYPYYHPPKP